MALAQGHSFDPFQTIISVKWSSTKIVGVWWFGEFGADASEQNVRVQSISPLGPDIAIVGGSLFLVNHARVGIFAIKRNPPESWTPDNIKARPFRLVTANPQSFTGLVDNVPDGFVSEPFFNLIFGADTLDFPEPTNNRWFSKLTITGQPGTGTLESHSLPPGATWADLLALAHLSDPGPIDGGDADVIGLAQVIFKNS